jgi:hypothetical protein
VFAFGFGIVLGYCFDTSGPVVAEDRIVERHGAVAARPAVVAAAPVERDVDEPVSEPRAADEPLTAERAAAHNAQPHMVTVGPHPEHDAPRPQSVVGDGRRVDVRED